jgi:broad specificity phosphatase PhoE
MILAAKTHQTGHIGISTHGGVIRRIMGWILSESEDPQATLEVPIPNAVLYVVQYEAAQDRWTVVEGPG